MALLVIAGEYDGDTTGAVMICSTTMWAFGPVFDDPQEVDCFQDWWGDNYSESIREASESQLKERFELFRRLVVRCRDCDEWTVAGGGLCDDCIKELRQSRARRGAPL